MSRMLKMVRILEISKFIGQRDHFFSIKEKVSAPLFYQPKRLNMLHMFFYKKLSIEIGLKYLKNTPVFGKV